MNSTASATGLFPKLGDPAPGERPRRTKIVCTLGPATSDAGRIHALALAGMDCARLNFSHGTHEDHLARIGAVRSAESLVSRPIAILADLCGPKIRIAQDAVDREVAPEDIVVLSGGAGRDGDLEVTFPELAEVVSPGQAVLIEDGRIRLRAIDRDGNRLRCLVETAGWIRHGKGVNVPDSVVPIPSLTEKDRDDLAFALAHGVDHVAISFVQTAEDVRELRGLIEAAGSGARIVSKIEKRDAVTNLDEIIDASDGVMVARGDLGVEIGPAEVPLVQKRMIALARAAGKTVITATQMLESMITSPEPTRAEVSDVANAILDGTSAVMLSAETASGDFPLRAVEVMDRVARAVEPTMAPMPPAVGGGVTDLLADAADRLATEARASAIAVHTASGTMARRMALGRPALPILAATTSELTWRQLSLDWGVIPVLVEAAASVEASWTQILDVLDERHLVDRGEVVILVGRTELPGGGSTGSVLVHQVGAG